MGTGLHRASRCRLRRSPSAMSTKASGDTARAASVPAWIEPQLAAQQKAAELVDDFAGNAEQGRFDRHLRPTRSEEGNVTAPEPERLAETPDRYGAFPRLSEAQIEALAAQGYRRGTQRGEVLFREGDPRCDFFVVLAGKVAIVAGYGGDQELIGVHGPGRFLGELNLLTGQTVFVTAVVREPGEVLVVPLEHLRDLVTRAPTLGDLILRVYLLRRSLLIELGAGFRIIGSRFLPDTRRLREVAARNRVPHRFIDL